MKTDKTDIPISSYWTADEVAECVDYWQHLSEKEGKALYSKLWDILNKAANPTPIGGDGSEGTVETPCGRLSLKNDDKASHWWHKISQREQAAICKALDLEGGAQ